MKYLKESQSATPHYNSSVILFLQTNLNTKRKHSTRSHKMAAIDIQISRNLNEKKWRRRNITTARRTRSPPQSWSCWSWPFPKKTKTKWRGWNNDGAPNQTSRRRHTKLVFLPSMFHPEFNVPSLDHFQNKTKTKWRKGSNDGHNMEHHDDMKNPCSCPSMSLSSVLMFLAI